MKSFKYQIVLFQLLGLLSTVGTYAQSFTKSKLTRISSKNITHVEVNSNYTNLEFEQIEGDKIILEASMQIDGLTQKEAENYFKKWKVKADNESNKVIISSVSTNRINSNWQRHGFYEGYFLNENQLTAISNKVNTSVKAISGIKQNNNLTSNSKKTNAFDYEAYINEGNAYLLKWQKENNEKIGKRWFNKTREERIAMFKGVKPTKPLKGNKTNKGLKSSKEEKLNVGHKIQQQAKLKKGLYPTANVRPLKKRAVIKKTLKIRIPKGLDLSIIMEHGKVILNDGISNINAQLKHVLLEAETISGNKTKIKGDFANFEIDHWQSGELDVTFSGYALIKRADEISLTSNASVVSVDAVTKSIDATGNFKMLNIEATPTIVQANIDVVDSKKVWIKLPDSPYNLNYKGVDSKIIHPEKFSLKTGKNRSEQTLENIPLKNSNRYINIKALASVMQIYDTPWEDLKIKNLEGL